jgi:hypothetical protein
MNHLKNFEEMNEDTSGGGGYTGPIALASLSGMGNPVTSVPSAIPGDAAGATIGSGDIGSGWTAQKTKNSFRQKKDTTSDIFGTSKRRFSKLTRGMKKSKDGLFQMANDLGKIKDEKKIKSFKDFIKK